MTQSHSNKPLNTSGQVSIFTAVFNDVYNENKKGRSLNSMSDFFITFFGWQNQKEAIASKKFADGTLSIADLLMSGLGILSFAKNTLKLFTEYLPALGIEACERAHEKYDTPLTDLLLVIQLPLLLWRHVGKLVTSPVRAAKDAFKFGEWIANKCLSNHPTAAKVTGAVLGGIFGLTSVALSAIGYVLAAPLVLAGIAAIGSAALTTAVVVGVALAAKFCIGKLAKPFALACKAVKTFGITKALPLISSALVLMTTTIYKTANWMKQGLKRLFKSSSVRSVSVAPVSNVETNDQTQGVIAANPSPTSLIASTTRILKLREQNCGDTVEAKVYSAKENVSIADAPKEYYANLPTPALVSTRNEAFYSSQPCKFFPPTQIILGGKNSAFKPVTITNSPRG